MKRNRGASPLKTSLNSPGGAWMTKLAAMRTCKQRHKVHTKTGTFPHRYFLWWDEEVWRVKVKSVKEITSSSYIKQSEIHKLREHPGSFIDNLCSLHGVAVALVYTVSVLFKTLNVFNFHKLWLHFKQLF